LLAQHPKWRSSHGTEKNLSLKVSRTGAGEKKTRYFSLARGRILDEKKSGEKKVAQ